MWTVGQLTVKVWSWVCTLKQTLSLSQSISYYLSKANDLSWRNQLFPPGLHDNRLLVVDWTTDRFQRRIPWSTYGVSIWRMWRVRQLVVEAPLTVADYICSVTNTAVLLPQCASCTKLNTLFGSRLEHRFTIWTLAAFSSLIFWSISKLYAVVTVHFFNS